MTSTTTSIKQNFSTIEQINYMAICLLERLGVQNVTESHIKIMETIFLLATNPRKITPQDIENSVGDDPSAIHIFRTYLSNRISEQPPSFADLSTRYVMRVTLKRLAHQINNIATYHVTDRNGEAVKHLVENTYKYLDAFCKKEEIITE